MIPYLAPFLWSHSIPQSLTHDQLEQPSRLMLLFHFFNLFDKFEKIPGLSDNNGGGVTIRSPFFSSPFTEPDLEGEFTLS
jgi:hypothetical protein